MAEKRLRDMALLNSIKLVEKVCSGTNKNGTN